ncbi:MAG: hypothetical protein R6X15_07475 [Pseudomonadota bacterium]
MATEITPFWHRIPKFFLYGLHPYPLILAGVLFVVSYFLIWPLIGFVFYAVIIKYASEALQHTVDGELTPPRLSPEVINENLELTFKLLVVYLCYFHVFAYLLDVVPWVLVLPLIVAAFLFLPALIISLVITEDMGPALNPFYWFSIAKRIGWPYMIMFLFLILFEFVQWEFGAIIGSRIPGQYMYPFEMAVETYFMVVIFHLMGYVVLQYRDELGFETFGTQDDEPESRSEHSTPLLERFIEEGKIDAALAEYSSLIKAHPEDVELRRKVYVFLLSNGQDERLKDYVPHYFSLLVAKGRLDDAASVYLDSHERGAPFVPGSPGDYLPVMKVLRHRGKSKQAVLLGQGFHKRFPNDPHTPELYLELAKLLSEDLQRDDLARNILAFLLKGFPDTALTPQIKQYMGLLTKLERV